MTVPLNDTSLPDTNLPQDSCGSCINGDTNYPDDADWWIRCKIGQEPKDNNVYKMCDKYQPREIEGM